MSSTSERKIFRTAHTFSFLPQDSGFITNLFCRHDPRPVNFRLRLRCERIASETAINLSLSSINRVVTFTSLRFSLHDSTDRLLRQGEKQQDDLEQAPYTPTEWNEFYEFRQIVNAPWTLVCELAYTSPSTFPENLLDYTWHCHVMAMMKIETDASLNIGEFTQV